MSRMVGLLLLLFLFATASAADPGDDKTEKTYTPTNPPTMWTTTTKLQLNTRVLRYCQENLKKTVGRGIYRGECAAMTSEALVFALARASFPPRKDTGNDGDYVWGQLVCTLTAKQLDASKVQPGDILQIRGPKKDPAFKGPAENGGVYWTHFVQHSSVVQATARTEDSWWLMTYDQNIAGPGGKMERWIHEGAKWKLADLQQGVTIWVYRPIPR